VPDATRLNVACDGLHGHNLNQSQTVCIAATFDNGNIDVEKVILR
jgi:hypothetical protein